MTAASTSSPGRRHALKGRGIAATPAAGKGFGDLVKGPKTRRITARVTPVLVAAARARTGKVSDSEIVELGLMALATADDFTIRMLELKGTIPKDLDLGI